MSFLDDDSFAAPPERRSRRTGPPGASEPPDHDRQILIRRLIAAGVVVLVLILIVLGIRGCVNARKERSFQNYVSDLTALTAESNGLSKAFFDRLEDPGNSSPLEFEDQVKADRGAAEGLLTRAQGLDAPDELEEAQGLIELAFELRRDALAVISDEIATAFAREGSEEATDAIAAQMRGFLASDVLFGRAQEQIRRVLEEQDIETEPVPGSQFLPDSPNWLSADVVSDALSGVSGSDAASPGVHGVALLQTTLLPTGALLEEGVPVTAAADGAELEVEVQNQGESEETDVVVTYSIRGGGDGSETISRIDTQETETVTIPLEPTPDSGEATIRVEVEPVEGEEIEDNNSATYDVTFE